MGYVLNVSKGEEGGGVIEYFDSPVQDSIYPYLYLQHVLASRWGGSEKCWILADPSSTARDPRVSLHKVLLLLK